MNHLTAQRLWRQSTLRGEKIAATVGVWSLLPGNFNHLLCHALNERESEGYTHFAMLHGDIVPQEGWLDVLHDEMSASGADIVSAVVPNKSAEGYVSMGVGEYRDGRPTWKRLTLKDVYELPETFTIEQTPWPDGVLLVNTGCLLIDLSAHWLMDWVNGGGFRFESYIDNRDGRYVVTCAPEDWLMSFDVHRLGGKVAATRKVSLTHHGDFGFDNHSPWGAAHSELAMEARS
jgi:hypothetical protein